MPLRPHHIALVLALALGPGCAAEPGVDAAAGADADADADVGPDAEEPEAGPEPTAWVWDLYGVTGRRYANAVAESEDGGVYVGGFDESTWGWVGRYDASGAELWALLLEPWVGDLASHPDGGVVAVGHGHGGGAFVARFGPDGQRAWTLEWPHERPWPSSVDAVEATPEGTFLIAGTLSTSTESSRAWIAELTAGGEVLWQRSLVDTTVRDASFELARDGDLLLAFRDEGDVWLARLERNGTPRWARHATGNESLGFDSLEVIETTDADVVLVATLHSGAEVVRFDAAGQLRWQRVLGTAGVEYGTVALPGPDGSALVGGTRIRDDDFDPNLWLAGVGRDGETLWQQVLTREGCDVAHDAVTARDGNVIVATGGCQHALVVKLGVDGSFDGGCAAFGPAEAASSLGGTPFEESALAPEDTHVVPTFATGDTDAPTSSILEVVCESGLGE